MTLTRKQREIRQREDLILRVARRLLLKDGYFGLGMERIAAATEYAKGTIYQHFRSKEDVLAGIMVDNLARRAELMARGATFSGSTRERMVAVQLADELHCRLRPDHVRAAELMELTPFIDRVAPARRVALSTWRQRNLGITQGLIRDAVAAGDLGSATGVEATVLIAIDAGAFGVRTLLTNDRDGHLGAAGVHEATATVLTALLDGCGWRPLSSERDYAAVRARAGRELFRSELERTRRG